MNKFFCVTIQKHSAVFVFIMTIILTTTALGQFKSSINAPAGFNKDQILGFKDEAGMPIISSEDTITDTYQTRSLIGFASGDNYGNSVNSAGDVNGDGYDDFIIGAPFNDGAANNAGRAYVYFGGLNVNTLPDVVLSGEGALNYFGNSASSAGDVNRDGYDDIIVGAYTYSNTGRAYVYFGGANMNNTADVIITGDSAGIEFGVCVSVAGDVNGDGYDDVIVGARSYGSNRTGRAYVYFGGASMNNTADVIFTGETTYSSFGYSAACAGDVNKDGYDDVIVGAYEYNTSAGKTYLYFGGSAMNNVSDLTFTGDATNSFSGWSVSSAGDVNADGFDDIVIGTPAYNGNSGKAAMFHGGAVMNNTADVIFNAPGTLYQLGVCVASAGDVNGDGYGDVIIGADMCNSAAGKAYVFYGGSAMNTTPDFIVSGEASGNFLGSSVACAGDVNRDGYSDIIAGAKGFSSNTGKAYLYMYGMSGFIFSDLSFNGEATNNYAGYSVASAGDVNGDGYCDIIVGAWGYTSNTGRAYIYLGGSTMDNTADVTITGDATGSYFGWSVASAGDVNGDGYCDVIIGAYAYSSYSGKAGVYFGGATMNNTVDVSMFGSSSNYNFGYSVASAGDVNGDGYCDVIVGANEYSTATGAAYVFYGGASMNNTPDVTMTGEATSNNFGASVSSAGDVNGDGYSDVIIGAYSYSTNTGRAYIFYGTSSMNNTADVTMTGDAGTKFGVSVSTAGDVNGDGYSDVIVGASSYSSFTGRANIYFGGMSMNNVSDLTMTGEGTNNYFGNSVSTAGDFNMDGYGDVIIGAYSFNNNAGKAYVYFGGIAMNSNADLSINGEASGNYFGISVASAGDVNGDGSRDLLVGASYYSTNIGRSYLYLNATPNVHPTIMSVKDVPEDQGGYVNVKWMRSAYDLNINGLITNYVIERRALTDYNNSDWTIVGTVPAIHNAIYNYEARTAYDSSSLGSAQFDFRVTAYTLNPGETWQSNILTGYSVDNLAPLSPQNLAAALNVNVVHLTWNPNSETDIRHYIIYRDDIQIGTSHTLNYADSTILPDSTYTFRISAEDIHGNIGVKSDSAMITYIVSTVNIKVIPQGYYNSISRKLNMRDTAEAFLHTSSSPYDVIDSAVSVIDSVSFTGSFKFPNASSGIYYIVLKHRNTIETWSRSGGETFTSGTIMNYDFTNAPSKAYGSNMIQVDASPLLYAIFSGDVNQDGTIDATDVSSIDNDAANFVTGYIPTDLTGDNFVDGSDFAMADNNAANFISVVRP